MTDVQTLTHLVSTYENTLYRAALAILCDPGEAEDAVQDTFLTYLEKAPEFETAEHQRAWLLRVLVNRCKSRLRSPWRRKRVPLTEAYPAHMPEESELLDTINRLPARERMVIHLYYYEGYKTAEIAQLTGEREGTIRSRLSRARARLRHTLKGADL